MSQSERGAPATAGLAARPDIELDDLRLEPSALTLHGRDGPVTVEPRVMQVLVALVDATGAVVSRQSLLASCWSGMVVGDDALHRAVAGARRALRDAGAVGSTIETIPRVGYRLVASVGQSGIGATVQEASTAPTGALDTSDTDDPQSALRPEPALMSTAGATAPTAVAPASASSRTPATSRRRTVLAAALAIAGVAAAAVWQARRREAVPAEVSAVMEQGRRALRLAVPEGDRQAATFFEQATAWAPRHAAAWGLLALARQQMSLATPAERLVEWFAAVEDAAAQALSLEPQQPDALTALALLVPAFGEWARIAASLQAVLDRHPEHPPAMDALATLMSSTGLVTAHYPLRLKVVQLDRFHAGYNFRSIYSHWMNGHIATADRAGERGLELWPRHLPTWLARQTLFKYTGRVDRAQAMLGSADSRPPMPAWLKSALDAVAEALATGSAADHAKARATLLHSLSVGGPLAAIGATLDLAALGDTALALDVTEAFLLERGPVTAGTAWQPGQALHHDVRHRFTNHLFLPVAAALRAHPRFAVIMKDVGMTAHWQRSGRQPDYLKT